MKILYPLLLIISFIYANVLQEAIDKAPPYSKLEIPNGIYTSPITITKPLILKGSKKSIIRGDSKGTLLIIKSSKVVIENLIFQNSGNQRFQLDAAIKAENGNNIKIKNCKFENTLFGIVFHDIKNSTIEDNIITSKKEKVVDNRGDAVRLWNSENIKILNNKIKNSRDISINRSKNVLIKNNFIKENRYGVLINMSRDINITKNKILSSYSGIYIQGGKHIFITKNFIIKSHLDTGTGILMAGGEDIHITRNRLKSHSQAIYISSSTAELGMQRYIEYNDISNNNAAFHFYKIIKNNTIKNNNVTDNLEDVIKDVRGGKFHNNDISYNYWDKYIGFDRNKDGINDTPYQVLIYADQLWQFDHHLKLFYATPLLSVIDLIERLAPFKEPVMLLEDKKPRQRPIELHLDTL